MKYRLNFWSQTHQIMQKILSEHQGLREQMQRMRGETLYLQAPRLDNQIMISPNGKIYSENYNKMSDNTKKHSNDINVIFFLLQQNLQCFKNSFSHPRVHSCMHKHTHTHKQNWLFRYNRNLYFYAFMDYFNQLFFLS